MIAQKTSPSPTHISENQSICASCPYFEYFNESSGRGWCKVMDTVARKHHRQSQVCDWEIAHYEQGSIVSKLPPCPYEIGQLVKIVDPKVADSRQWKTYVVVGRKYNSGRYRSTESYLKESNWDFGLKAIEQNPQTSSEIWVSEDRLCNAGGSQKCQCYGGVLRNI